MSLILARESSLALWTVPHREGFQPNVKDMFVGSGVLLAFFGEPVVFFVIAYPKPNKVVPTFNR